MSYDYCPAHMAMVDPMHGCIGCAKEAADRELNRLHGVPEIRPGIIPPPEPPAPPAADDAPKRAPRGGRRRKKRRR